MHYKVREGIRHMKFQKYDRVIFVDREAHIHRPDYYPEVGTIGVVKDTNQNIVRIQWPTKSTSGEDC